MGDPALTAEFEALLRRHHEQLISFVRGLLHDGQQAHDVVQDVFVAAWRALQQRTPPFACDDDAGRQRWLFRVAYNRVISHLRHQRLIAWEPLDDLAVSKQEVFYAPVAFEDQIAEGEALRAALARLPSLDAACLLLNVVHGFRAREIAQIVEIAPEAAKKRLWRAKERLRAAYFVQETPVSKSIRP